VGIASPWATVSRARRPYSGEVTIALRVLVILLLASLAGCQLGSHKVHIINPCPQPVEVLWWSASSNGDDPDLRDDDRGVYSGSFVVDAASTRNHNGSAGFTTVYRVDDADFRVVLTSEPEVSTVDTVELPASLCR